MLLWWSKRYKSKVHRIKLIIVCGTDVFGTEIRGTNGRNIGMRRSDDKLKAGRVGAACGYICASRILAVDGEKRGRRREGIDWWYW